MVSTKARELRKSMTDAEQRLWQKLKRRQIASVKFRRQQPIGPFIVDFVCFECRLIVEVDGSQHAESQHNTTRDRWLGSTGYRVLRFWNSDVFQNRDGVLETIVSAARGATPLPSPPRQGGRGPTGAPGETE